MERMLEATARAEDAHYWFLGLRRVARQMLTTALNGARPRRIIDCGTGTGRNLDWLHAFGDVVGIDRSPTGIAAARTAGRRVVQGVVDALPFKDGCADVATSFDVLYSLPDETERKALAEMRRVLAPGGRVAILDFGKPDGPTVSALYSAYLGVAMPLVGWLFHGDADTYRYIPASLERYPGQRGVERLMREAGFVNSRFENALLGTMGINLGEKPTG